MFEKIEKQLNYRYLQWQYLQWRYLQWRRNIYKTYIRSVNKKG